MARRTVLCHLQAIRTGNKARDENWKRQTDFDQTTNIILEVYHSYSWYLALHACRDQKLRPKERATISTIRSRPFLLFKNGGTMAGNRGTKIWKAEREIVTSENPSQSTELTTAGGMFEYWMEADPKHKRKQKCGRRRAGTQEKWLGCAKGEAKWQISRVESTKKEEQKRRIENMYLCRPIDTKTLAAKWAVLCRKHLIKSNTNGPRLEQRTRRNCAYKWKNIDFREDAHKHMTCPRRLVESTRCAMR